MVITVCSAYGWGAQHPQSDSTCTKRQSAALHHGRHCLGRHDRHKGMPASLGCNSQIAACRGFCEWFISTTQGRVRYCWLPAGMAGYARYSKGEVHLGQAVAQLGGKDVGQGHELGGLIGGVAKHVALVTSTDLLQGFCAQTMYTLANVW